MYSLSNPKDIEKFSSPKNNIFNITDKQIKADLGFFVPFKARYKNQSTAKRVIQYINDNIVFKSDLILLAEQRE